MNPLNSPIGLTLLGEFQRPLREFIRAVEASPRIDRSPDLTPIRERIIHERNAHSEDKTDDALNDLYILNVYLNFFESYGLFWRKIAFNHYSKSWDDLQNAFDALRLIYQFSAIKITTLEHQLYAIEELYPYKLFCSIGAVVESFECSICGKDIDGMDCSHRRGQLYRGQRAVAIAKNIKHLDHIALVKNPVDKRCVISYDDKAPAFDGVRALADFISNGKFQISQFVGVRWSKRQVLDVGVRGLGRNARCHCSSGAKYKKCCLGKLREIDHIDFLGGGTLFEQPLA
ncbi:YecA family protein [Roseateles sp. P5_E11]